jgi:hypothetical protein
MNRCCVKQVCGVVVTMCTWFQAAPARHRLAVLAVLLAAIVVTWWYSTFEVGMGVDPSIDIQTVLPDEPLPVIDSESSPS